MRIQSTVLGLLFIFSTAAFASQPGTGVKYIACDVATKAQGSEIVLVVNKIEGLKVAGPVELNMTKGRGASINGQAYYASAPTGIENQEVYFNASVGNAADNFRLGELQVALSNGGKFSDSAYCRLNSSGQFK